jgi:sulfonate transport system substrate-binding protein
LFLRDHDKNTYGTLNVRSEFAEQHPEVVEKVIEVYEKARKWVVENPEEAAEILAKEADMPVEVARKSLERNDFSDPIPGAKQIESLQAAGKVLQSEKVIKENVDVEKIVKELIIDRYSKKVID